MKKILVLSLALLLCCSMRSQTFMGVPVNGSAAEMAKKLEPKGFTKIGPYKESLVIEGKYNGKKTNVILCTYEGRVNRVCVNYLTGLTEAQVKQEYNALMEQFRNDPKYTERTPQALIAEDEELTDAKMNNVKFQATFYEEPAFDPKYQNLVRPVKALVAKPAAKQKQDDKVKAVSLIAQLPGMEDFKKTAADMNPADVDGVLAQGLEMVSEKFSGVIWMKMRSVDDGYGLTVFYDNPINMPPAE